MIVQRFIREPLLKTPRFIPAAICISPAAEHIVQSGNYSKYEFQITAFDDAGNESVKAGKFAVNTDLVSADAAALDLIFWQDGSSAETSFAAALDSIVDDWKRQPAISLLA